MTMPCRLVDLCALAEWVVTGVGMMPLRLQREYFFREGVCTLRKPVTRYGTVKSLHLGCGD